MHRSSNNLLNSRQPPVNVDNYKRLSEQVMKPTSARTSHQSPITQNDEWDNDHRKLITNQPLNPSRSRSPSHISLKSMVIDGRWKYQGHDEDRLRLKSIGIENLVSICHDIMSQNYESTNRKHEKRRKSPSTHTPFPLVKLDGFKKLTNTERTSFQRAHLFNLMNIVYEAASTSASISELVRIWREVSEHNSNPRHAKKAASLPPIQYEKVFQHLMRTPDNHLLQIALHASLINMHRRDLKHLGEKLGININQMESVRDSIRAFQNLIQFLREQKLKHRREQKHINTGLLPYQPKEKQDLYANVSGTRFRLSK
jgi:hypothetical protein